MQLRALQLMLLVAISSVPGCVTPWNTRLPRVAPSPPAAEGRSYQVHDPFPEEDLGPETQVRPREYIESRPAPRRAIEGNTLMGVPPAGPMLPPPSSYNYSGVVRE